MSRKDDIRWMQRALALARRGEALTSPNPMVGAVLVKGGRVVGEGFHTYAGVKHAEVLALEKAGKKARGATLYINLEPCCHTGRTGPCTRALIAAGVKRVVAVMPDPNPAVSGRGFRELRRAGIRVTVGVCEEEAKRLNEAFAKWIRTRRPLVILKIASTLDAKISSRRTRWVTSPESRKEVQQMRHAADAVLTGIGTVLADNPRLTDRSGLPRRRRLLRVVLDSNLRLSPRSRLARSARGDVLLFASARASPQKARALARAGVEVVRLRGRRPVLAAVLRELGRREILRVLFECGATLNGAALAAGVVDRLVLFYAPKLFGESAVPMLRPHARSLAGARLRNLSIRYCGPDTVIEGTFRDVYRNR